MARKLTYRHAALVRVTHWLNAVFFVVMLMTGLQIFNAHPALYIGKQSDFDKPTMEISAFKTENGPRGYLTIAGHKLDTTGVLGLSKGSDGGQAVRAFPAWATLPGEQDLADGRRWHFFFAFLLIANATLYWLWGLLSRHVWRDLVPTREEIVALPRTTLEHIKLRFPHGEEARRYNGLQQLSYLLVIVVLFPLLVLTGLTMSPRMDAQWPWLLDFFGGRQTARSIHFLMAFSLVLFVIVHVVMVLLSGFWNNIRSMVTGRFAIDEEAPDAA